MVLPQPRQWQVLCNAPATELCICISTKALQWHLQHACKGYNLKNNQPVQWWHRSMPQQVIHGTCCGNATWVLLPLSLLFLWLLHICSNNKPIHGSALPASCTLGISWRWLAGICGMHARVKIRNNQPVQQQRRSTMPLIDNATMALCRGNDTAKWAMLPMSLCWSFDFFLWLFTPATKTTFVALPASCIGGSLLASAACTQELCQKTINQCDDGIDRWCSKSLVVLVVAMTQQSEQCRSCHSAEIMISSIGCFAFAPATKTTFVALPVSCIGGGLLASTACMQELC